MNNCDQATLTILIYIHLNYFQTFPPPPKKKCGSENIFLYKLVDYAQWLHIKVLMQYDEKSRRRSHPG